MRLQNPLGALCPTLESEILLALAQEDGLTPGQLVRSKGIGGSVSGARKCLERLTSGGLVRERSIGNRREYSLNKDHLLAEVVTRAVNARAQFLSQLQSRIAQWTTNPVQVTLFGSAARGDMRDESDIDLLVIVEDDPDDEFFEDLNDRAIHANALTGNDVRPLVYEISEVLPAPIFDSILRDGVHVYGDQQWLRQRLGLTVAA